ncbi:hypothetical protein D3C75_1054860 [compost metagenome]
MSSMVISATSLSGVSEMAMVPDSELRMPTLMVSAACTLQAIPIPIMLADSAKAFIK